MNTQPSYIFIRLWGRELGSFGYYINDQIEKAKRDGAPWNAIYERDGHWSTIDDIKGDDRKIAFYKRAAKIAHGGEA